MCSSRTMKEVFERKLFGTVKRHFYLVERIKPTTALFLLNFSRPKALMGVYIADSQPGMNIEPKAWNGRFPSQIRFKRVAKLITRNQDLCTKKYSTFLSKDEVYEIIHKMQSSKR